MFRNNIIFYSIYIMCCKSVRSWTRIGMTIYMRHGIPIYKMPHIMVYLIWFRPSTPYSTFNF